MFQFHPANPFRPVNWRWERARIVGEKASKAINAKTDAWIDRAAAFWTSLNRAKDEIGRYALMDDNPIMYSAYLIYNSGGDEDRHPLRHAIEARLLAGQTYEDIAERIGIEPETIEAYERLFFNVTEKLKNSDYIMTCVLGPSVHSGLTDREYDLLWKLFGYLYGPVVLDAFILATSRRFRPEQPNEVDIALAEDARSSLQRKVAVVARTFTVNQFSQSELLNTYTRLLEVEKTTDSAKAQDVIMQNIQIMLDKLPLASGPENQSVQLTKYDEYGSELRTDELIKASVGEDIDEPKQIEDLTFPEPKNVKAK